MKVRLNVDLLDKKMGDILDDEILNTTYWRNRIKDSEIDNCLTIINEVLEDKKKKSKQEEK